MTATTGTGPPLGAEEVEALFDAHRGAIRAHCYRMTGSFADAEELAQETFLRAWRDVGGFEGRSSPTTWLYRIATNACLDFLKSHQRRARPRDTIDETLEREAWIDPYPDRGDPARIVADHETTDLYLAAALLHLPPRQRAVVVARDLLELSAAETASILDCTATAVHSLLQRAHGRLRTLAPSIDGLVHPPSRDDDEIVGAYLAAHRRHDVGAIVDLLAADVRISMPPEPPCLGRADAHAFFTEMLGPDGVGSWRIVPVRANGAPAVANYLRRPGDGSHRALSIDVVRVEGGRITAISCFLGDAVFPAFGLPPTAPSGPARAERTMSVWV